MPKAKALSRSRSKPAAPLDVAAALRELTREPPQAPEPVSERRPRNLEVHRDPGETDDEMLAKTVLRPTVRAAQTIAALDNTLGEHDLTALVDKLSDQVTAVRGNDLSRAEEMLIAQAHTLDMLFHKLIHRSMANSKAGYLDASETYMRLALRAQSQCRATLETLSVVKNPPSVAFVRQANIANGPQQVNNGTSTGAPKLSRAREIPQSQLLEHQGGERLDLRAAQASDRGDPAMAPVGKINGAAHARG